MAYVLFVDYQLKTIIKMRRWKRLGLSKRLLEEFSNNATDSFMEVVSRIEGTLEYEVPEYERQMALNDCVWVCFLKHLEFPSSPNLDTVVEIGSKCVLDYFFGDWRNEAWHESGKIFDEATNRKKLEWLAELRRGMCIALLKQDTALLKKIAGYVDSDLKFDDAYMTCDKYDDRYWRLFSRYVAENSLVNCKRDINFISKSSSQRPKKLLAMLQAIDTKDHVGFLKNFETYLRHFMRSEFELNIPHPSVDGTIMFLYARDVMKLNIDESGHHSNYLDVVMRPETIQ